MSKPQNPAIPLQDLGRELEPSSNASPSNQVKSNPVRGKGCCPFSAMLTYQWDEKKLYGSGEFPHNFYKYAKKEGGVNSSGVIKGKDRGLSIYSVNMPGPNTTLYLNYAGVKDGLIQMADRLQSGEYYRGNLFGMFWNFPMPFKKWPEAVMPGLAWQNGLHSRVRPEMDACWTPAPHNPQGPEFVPFDEKDIRANARAFIDANTDSAGVFKTERISDWAALYLHHQEMDLQLSPAELESFNTMTGGMLKCTILPGFVVPIAQLGGVVPKNVIKLRDEWVARYKTALRAKYSDKKYDDEMLHLLAMSFMAANVYAGGASVPTTIVSTMCHAIVSNQVDDMNEGLSATSIPTVLKLAVWETIRLCPPAHATSLVKGTSNMAKGKQEKLFFPTACRDPAVYGTARPNETTSDWNIRRPMELANEKERAGTEKEAEEWFAKTNVAFADFATGERPGTYNHHTGEGLGRNPNARYCPGKWLAVAMIAGFLAELDLRTWAVDPKRPLKAQPRGYQGGNYFQNFNLVKKRY